MSYDGVVVLFFFFSSRRRHTRFKCDWSSDVCSSDLSPAEPRTIHTNRSTLIARLLPYAGRGPPSSRRVVPGWSAGNNDIASASRDLVRDRPSHVLQRPGLVVDTDPESGATPRSRATLNAVSAIPPS